MGGPRHIIAEYDNLRLLCDECRNKGLPLPPFPTQTSGLVLCPKNASRRDCYTTLPISTLKLKHASGPQLKTIRYKENKCIHWEGVLLKIIPGSEASQSDVAVNKIKI